MRLVCELLEKRPRGVSNAAFVTISSRWSYLFSVFVTDSRHFFSMLVAFWHTICRYSGRLELWKGAYSMTG